MTMNNPSPQDFVNSVNHDCNHQFSLPLKGTHKRRWMSFFGSSPELCCIIWSKLDVQNTMASEGYANADYKHLMWALYFLKAYGNEECNSNFAGGADEKTFRKWTRIFVEAISYLEASVVSLCDG